MRNLLRCRRGSVAFATVVALVPLIGAVALGAEAGSWYVTRNHAQNAADAAAYSGAVQQACANSGSGNCNTTQDYIYRGKQFAAQNAFCNAGDTTAYPGSHCLTNLPTGTSQTVQITLLTSWNGNNGAFVQATVSQQQPAYLAGVLGLSTVNIGATAVAAVQGLQKPPCALALSPGPNSGPSISFQGSPNINAPNCGMASNDPAANAINFTGGGTTMNLGSLSTVGGCKGSTTFCNTALTYMPAPIPDPFAALDSALITLCGANPSLPAKCGLPKCPSSGLFAYAGNACVNDGSKTKGNTAVTLTPGVYFISGTLTLTGGSSLTGTGVTLILLPGANIDTKGGGTLTITGPTTAPSASSLPTALQPDASLFRYMAIYDASNTPVQFGGNSNINLTGNIYAPTAAVTFQGNPTISLGNGTSCGELIAASIAFNGNATFDSSGCPTATKVSVPQYVQLVR
jgi:hypothetical protein